MGSRTVPGSRRRHTVEIELGTLGNAGGDGVDRIYVEDKFYPYG